MKIIKAINFFFQKLNSDHIGEYTAQCAYFSFLSFIPFIILLLSLIKYMNIEKETLEYTLEAMLPTIMKSSVLDIIQEVYSKSIETVSISAIFMLWSAAKSFYALNLGLASVYKSEEEENHLLIRIKGVIGTIIILGSIIAVLVLLVFGNSINEMIEVYFNGFNKIINFILNIRGFIVMFSLFFVFLVVYRFVPGKKGLKFKNQIPGAIFSSVAWYLVSYFFSIYVDIFTNFSIIYGSLATITLIMMWLYTIIYIIFIGSEINIIFAKLKNTSKLFKSIRA